MGVGRGRGRPPYSVIPFPARLFGRAKPSIGENSFHVLAGGTAERDFEIVDGDRAVHRKTRGVTTMHEVDENRRHTALDDVTTEPPENRFARCHALWR